MFSFLKIIVDGSPVWTEEFDYNLYIYGVEFIMDENGRKDLMQFLNQVQMKMKNNILFDEGSFVAEHPINFFKQLTYKYIMKEWAL